MIENTIFQMIAEAKHLPNPVTDISNLYTDLGFDSLSLITLLLKIEESYSITFNIFELEKCVQVYQLINLVKDKIEEEGELV